MTALDLENRVAQVRERIARAALQAGRKAEEITLCAACKGQDAEIIRLCAGLAVDAFGENRMQEMREHLKEGAYGGKPCHFIGAMQTNKARGVVGQAALIHSVDSARLLTAVQAEAARLGITQDILFEINLAGEERKAGIRAGDLRGLMDQAAACPNIRVRGLMAIPPAVSRDEARPHFAALRGLLDDMKSWGFADSALNVLSMGMSDSYEAAILEGATIVRVGRAIFGDRK
jgi:pyridoxal phosphate enzyme (YggS family)